MADVEAALAQAAAEDGGALFECRPRGLPPGRLGRVLAVVVIVAPFLSGWCDVAALRLRGRDHPRRWTGDWSSVWLHVEDERGVTHSARGLGPGWGPASPLLKGVDVPWLLLGATGFATLELLRHARYRSRRIVVTRDRVLVGEGIVGVHLFAWERPGRPTLAVRRGDATLWSHRPIALGRLDPLDLIELAARVGAAPTPPASPRGRRGQLGLAAAALLGACWILGLVAPWRASLRIERGAAPYADQVTLVVDAPAWGTLRTRAPLFERSGGVVFVRSTSAQAPFGACQVRRLVADGETVSLMSSALQEATNGWLRRVERRSVQALESAGEGARRLKTSPGALGIAGLVELVEGDPIPFDVTLDPGQAVTLDLGDAR